MKALLVFLLLAATGFAQPSVSATSRTTAERVREVLRQMGPGAEAAGAVTGPSVPLPEPSAASPALPPGAAAATATGLSPAPSTPTTGPAAQQPTTAPASPLATASALQSQPSTAALVSEASKAPVTSTAPLTPSTGSIAPASNVVLKSAAIPLVTTSTPLASASPSRLPTDGAINVTSDPPGAEVVLDRRVEGTTPLFKRGLAPGFHELELMRAGAPIHRRRIKVAAGKVLNLRLPGSIPGLAPPESFEEGTITLEVEPKGASVYLPGRKLLGKTPVRAHPLKAGVYTLTFEAKGHRKEERDIRVEPRREARAVFSLTPGADLIDVFRKRRRDRERDLYLAESRRLLAKKQYDMALERSRQALAADPESYDVFRLLAEIYAAAGDRAGEAEARQKAAALAPRKEGDWRSEAESIKAGEPKRR